VLIKIVCFLSAFSTVNWMIVAACLFHDLSTALHSTMLFHTYMNRIPSLFQWKSPYNQPKIRICQIKIILAEVNNSYLIIDDIYLKRYVSSPFLWFSPDLCYKSTFLISVVAADLIWRWRTSANDDDEMPDCRLSDIWLALVLSSSCMQLI